jgi:hypothetical protein
MIVDAFTISAAVVTMVIIVTVVALMRANKSVNKSDS